MGGVWVTDSPFRPAKKSLSNFHSYLSAEQVPFARRMFEFRTPLQAWLLWTHLLGLRNIFGCILDVAAIMIMDRLTFHKQHVRSLKEHRSAVAPEHRLYFAMLGTLAVNSSTLIRQNCA